MRFYAELLPRLNVVWVFIEADCENDATPTGEPMGTDGANIQVHQGNKGVSTIIPLPVPVKLDKSEVVKFEKVNSSLARVKLHCSVSNSTGHNTLLPDSCCSIPWSVDQLQREKSITFSCRYCNLELCCLSQSHTTWKPLPSSNWQEMMDFWHCHKPPPLSVGEDAPFSEKFAQFSCEKGTVFVGVTSFLFSAEDLNAQIDKEKQKVECSKCYGLLGHFTSKGNILTCEVLKWDLLVKPSRLQYPATSFIAALLSDYTATDAEYRFEIRSQDEQNEGDSARLALWVLNEVVYTSQKKKIPKKATKVLFNPAYTSPRVWGREIDVPTWLIDSVISTLNLFTESLPVGLSASTSMVPGFKLSTLSVSHK